MYVCYIKVPLSRGLRQIMGSNLKIQIKLREEETPEIPDVQGKTVYWVATAIEYFGKNYYAVTIITLIISFSYKVSCYCC